MLEAVREAMQSIPGPQHVCSIGVSGQQHGMVVLDELGQASLHCVNCAVMCTVRCAERFKATKTSAAVLAPDLPHWAGNQPPPPRPQVIRPAKLWCDTESAAEAREMSEALGYRMVGARCLAGRCLTP